MKLRDEQSPLHWRAFALWRFCSRAGRELASARAAVSQSNSLRTENFLERQHETRQNAAAVERIVCAESLHFLSRRVDLDGFAFGINDPDGCSNREVVRRFDAQIALRCV